MLEIEAERYERAIMGKVLPKSKKNVGCSISDKGRDKLKDREQKEWWNTKKEKKHKDFGERDGAISLVIWHNKAKQ